MSDGTLPQSLLVWPGQCVITSYSSGDEVCAHATALWVVLYLEYCQRDTPAGVSRNGKYPKSIPTIMRSNSPGSVGFGLGLFWPRARPWRLERSEVVIWDSGRGFATDQRDGGGGSERKERKEREKEENNDYGACFSNLKLETRKVMQEGSTRILYPWYASKHVL